MKELKDIYHKDKLIVDLIGTNKDLQNDLRMTDIKRFSIVIEQAYNDITNNEKSIISHIDLTRALYELKNNKQWEIVIRYLQGKKFKGKIVVSSQLGNFITDIIKLDHVYTCYNKCLQALKEKSSEIEYMYSTYSNYDYCISEV